MEFNQKQEIDGLRNETVIYHPADWHESVDLIHTIGANRRIRFTVVASSTVEGVGNPEFSFMFFYQQGS